MRSGPRPRLKAGELAAALQASIPGLYAWALTVAPALWSGLPGSRTSRIFAALAPATLVFDAFALRVFGESARYVGLWSFALACSAAWLTCPGILGPTQLDVARLLAAMVGWALFALSTAAPAEHATAVGARPKGVPLRPRAPMPAGDLLYIGFGIAAAVGIETLPPRVPGPERELLVRLSATTAAIAALGACTEVALARHDQPHAQSRLGRLGALLVSLAWLSVLALVGLLGFDQGW